MIFAAAVIGVRRALIKDQARPLPCTDPLWKLLLGEVALLIRRITTWKLTVVLGAAFVSAIAVQIALSSATPGPVLTSSWRWIVAALMTVVVLFVWAVVHAVRAAKAPVVETTRTPHPLAGTRRHETTHR